jgi:hypothetical protein
MHETLHDFLLLYHAEFFRLLFCAAVSCRCGQYGSTRSVQVLSLLFACYIVGIRVAPTLLAACSAICTAMLPSHRFLDSAFSAALLPVQRLIGGCETL